MSGAAATIQFPHGTIGERPVPGFVPATDRKPKHIAVPCHPVRVGVQKTRKREFVAPSGNHHPAPIGHGGQMPTGDGGIHVVVGAAKTGSPRLTAKLSGFRGMSGYPIITGDDPGANGA